MMFCGSPPRTMPHVEITVDAAAVDVHRLAPRSGSSQSIAANRYETDSAIAGCVVAGAEGLFRR